MLDDNDDQVEPAVVAPVVPQVEAHIVEIPLPVAQEHQILVR